MNIENILTLYDKDLRIHRMYPEARREVNGDVVRFLRQAPGMNLVAFTFATERTLDPVIAREVAYLAPFEQPFTWKVYDHDRLPRLRTKLLDQHFAEDSDPAAVMVLDVTRAPAQIFQFDPTLHIERLTSVDKLRAIVEVLDAVYGGSHDWVYNRMGVHLRIPKYLSAYAVCVDGRPVSVAWTYFPEGHFATLFGGTTLAEYRSRGLYSSLLAVRLNEIRQRGYPFAVVETGPMSRPIVAKRGFQQVSTVWDYAWQREP
jgi:hypothetical protein